MSGIIKKFVQLSIRNLKDSFEFRFFKEILSFKILCENEMFGMILFPFSVVFVQIIIFSFKKIY